MKIYSILDRNGYGTKPSTLIKKAINVINRENQQISPFSYRNIYVDRYTYTSKYGPVDYKTVYEIRAMSMEILITKFILPKTTIRLHRSLVSDERTIGFTSHITRKLGYSFYYDHKWKRWINLRW